jgi:CubicO group peptidase (beta-lactamase class C family)
MNNPRTHLFAVLAMLALFAAQGAFAQAAKPAAAEAVKPAATGQPAADSDNMQGLSRSRVARIAPSMKEQIDKNVFPGAVTIVARHGKVVHFEAHGYMDAGKSKPMTKDALFRLASMTKPIVTAAAMMLVEQGKMNRTQGSESRNAER